MPEEPFSEEEVWKDFDLSELTYPQFLTFFFDRPVVGDKESYDLFRGGIDYFVASNPTIVVGHVQAMCRELPELTKIYSREQLDQGLWAVFGAAISCEQFLFDPAVGLGLRIECIESMYLPFRDVVAKTALGKCESFYWMWWDMILHTFWQDSDLFVFDYPGLSGERKQIGEAMFQTLLKILALNHPACQWSALHGLGHLHHPGVPATVRRYLDTHRKELTADEVRWVEASGDGKIA